MTCSYEEVTTGGYLPLWFNQPDGAMLFQFLKQPISYHQYTGRKRENRRERSHAVGGPRGGDRAYRGVLRCLPCLLRLDREQRTDSNSKRNHART